MRVQDQRFIDVSNLNVPASRYRVFDAAAIETANLALTAATDKTHWSLELDRDASDVWLNRN